MNKFTGYVPNPEGTERFLNALSVANREPDGKKVANNLFKVEKKTIILSSYLIKAFPNWNSGYQGIGDCMSWSAAHNVDVLMGVQVFLQNLSEEIVAQVCSETQYGFMRVEVYGQINRSGDGAYGGNAAKSILKFGTLHRLEYMNNKYDFRIYSGSRAKLYGRIGVPDDLEPIAREHIVQDTTLVKDFDTAAKFIMNGYPISNAASYNPVPNSRDKNGYGQRYSTYAHAMNYIGVRWEPNPALLKTNTGWGPVSGEHWPDNLNQNIKKCSWWEDADRCDKVLKENDSFVYSQYRGFKAQKLPDYGTGAYL